MGNRFGGLAVKGHATLGRRASRLPRMNSSRSTGRVDLLASSKLAGATVHRPHPTNVVKAYQLELIEDKGYVR